MYQKLLVPLDGSEVSECSLEHVKAIASGCHVPSVVLFQVMEPIYEPSTVRVMLGEGFILKAEEKEKENVLSYLNGIREDLIKSGINVEIHATGGRPADSILDYSEKNSVDLIIMGTHGRSGIARWALGSVADKVIRNSKVPVLMVVPRACRTQD
jgi:nucleotide-binding universal stress UspA family protein